MAGNKTRIMYIELKTGYADNGPARIGRVSFSRSGRRLYYKGKEFAPNGGMGVARRGEPIGNYFDVETGEEYWISGPKKNGQDRRKGSAPVEIDEDVAEEYWSELVSGLQSPQAAKDIAGPSS